VFNIIQSHTIISNEKATHQLPILFIYLFIYLFIIMHHISKPKLRGHRTSTQMSFQNFTDLVHLAHY